MLFADEPTAGGAQRRSKAEMVCELMLAISRGAVRPTKIMQRANLTWNALLVYLNSLAMNGLVKREERGTATTYLLTDKGRETLAVYLALREKLEPLRLESTDIKKVMKSVAPPPPAPATPSKDILLERLRGEGYRILSPSVSGKSGVKHEFAIVAKDREGVTHGYLLAEKPDEKLVLGLFITQLDTGLRVHVAHTHEPHPAALERAREYGVVFDRVELGPQAGKPKALPQG